MEKKLKEKEKKNLTTNSSVKKMPTTNTLGGK